MTNDELLPSDQAFTAFLAEIPYERALLDYAPHTEVEIRHLSRTRRTAA